MLIPPFTNHTTFVILIPAVQFRFGHPSVLHQYSANYPRSPSRSTSPTTLAQYFDPNPQSNRIKIFSPLYLIPSSNSLFYSVISITCMPLNNTRGRREKAAADRGLPHIPSSPLIRHKPCSWQKNKLINHLLRIYVLFWGSPLRMAFDPA